MDNQQEKKNQPQSKTKQYFLLGTAASLLIGAFLIGKYIPWSSEYQTSSIASPLSVAGETVKTTIQLFDSDQIHGTADEHPLVTMIEYGSLTCPHCASFHSEHLPSIKSKYIETKKIQYIYRDYPLDGAALKAALLARCDLSKRQAFINLLYKKQSEWTKATNLLDIEKNLMILGRSGGLSDKQIKECLTSKETTRNILNVQKSSEALYHIEATPTVIINDQKFNGGKPAEELSQIIEQLLSKEQSNHYDHNTIPTTVSDQKK